jgi:hypothetical protein
MSLYKIVLVICALMICDYIYAGEVQDINNSFSFYKKTLTDNNPVLAVGLITQSSLDYYADLKRLALHANSDQIKNLDFSQKMLVLIFRMRITKNELQGMSARQLVMHAIKNGWISKAAMKNYTLGEINITGSTAYAEYKKAGRPSKSKLVFVKEEGAWKFDLVALMSEADKYMKAYADRANVSENKLVEALVERSTGQKVTPALWNGF